MRTIYRYHYTFAFKSEGKECEIVHKSKSFEQHTPESLQAEIDFRLQGFYDEPAITNTRIVSVIEYVCTPTVLVSDNKPEKHNDEFIYFN